MATIRILYSSLLLVGRAAAWSLTNYFTTSISTSVIGSSTFTISVPVSPTGSVSATSTNISTSAYSDGLTYEITVTNLFLPTNAPVCVPSAGFNIASNECNTSSTPSTTASRTITTRYFAPLIISNPSSCTLTSFSYTSSQVVFPTYLPSSLGTQAMESAEALFITTHVVTVSTNLGGQAVTTSVCDVYLKSDAITGVTPEVEASYLSQCVDPSKFRCKTTWLGPSDDVCGPLPITYPRGGKTGGVTGTSSGAGSSTTSKGGAEGLAGAVHWGLFAGAMIFTILWLTWV